MLHHITVFGPLADDMAGKLAIHKTSRHKNSCICLDALNYKIKIAFPFMHKSTCSRYHGVHCVHTAFLLCILCMNVFVYLVSGHRDSLHMTFCILWLQIGSRSSVYSPVSRVRTTGSYVYEEFMPTDGTDVKV